MIHLILGRRENGKTTLAMYMASKVSHRLIFDPRGLIGGGPRVETPAALSASMPELYEGNAGQLAFTPTGDLEGGFDWWSKCAAEWIRRDASKPIALVVDEVAFIRLERSQAFQWVCRCSRRDVVQIFVTGHRPRDVHTSIRAIADHWLLFAFRQEHDLRVLEERCSEATVRAVEKLGPRQFVHWDDAIAASRVFRDPAAWYVDLAAPVGRPGAPLDDGEPVEERPSFGLFL